MWSSAPTWRSSRELGADGRTWASGWVAAGTASTVDQLCHEALAENLVLRPLGVQMPWYPSQLFTSETGHQTSEEGDPKGVRDRTHGVDELFQELRPSFLAMHK